MSDELIEAMARIIDPSSWRVMDGYLAQMLRKYKGEHIGYDPDAFKHKESMAIARAVLPVIRAHLEPTSEMVDAARKKGQDEGFASAVSWLRDRSAQKPAAYLALEADMLANGLENSRKAYVSLSQEPSHAD